MARRLDGSKMKQLRKAKGLSQEELAEMVGIEKNTLISWYESNVKVPSAETLGNIADVLGVTVDSLLRRV